jgi:hypothetical protein
MGGELSYLESPELRARGVEMVARMEKMLWTSARNHRAIRHTPRRANAWSLPLVCKCRTGWGCTAGLTDEDFGLPRKHIYAEDPHPDEDLIDEDAENVMFARLWKKLVDKTRKHRQDTGSGNIDSEFVTIDEMLASYGEGPLDSHGALESEKNR